MEIQTKKKIVTHSGSFHADDVFAVAMLSLVLGEDAIEVIRTREQALIESADYVVDVGGIYEPNQNRFDHHQTESAGMRKNGIAYAASGLVWKTYGLQLSGSEAIAKRVDERLIQAIDATDNGMQITTPLIANVFPYTISDIVAAFLPSVLDEDEVDSLPTFMYLVSFARKVLVQEITKAKDQEYIHTLVKKVVESPRLDPRIVIFEEHVPRVPLWIEMLNYPEVLFALSPQNKEASLWRMLTIPLETSFFTKRKPLPASWAGKRDAQLAEITGVEDAVFCHKDLFLAVTKSREGLEQLAQLAITE